MAYKPFPNLFISSLIRHLQLNSVSHLQTLYLTNVSSKEEPRHFLICHYITFISFSSYLQVSGKKVIEHNLVVGCALYSTINSIYREVFRKPYETVKLSVPALLYVVQNNVLLIALTNLNSATYQVCYMIPYTKYVI